MKRHMMPVFVFVVLFGLSALVAANNAEGAPSSPRGGWLPLMAEDFEGEFPAGLWHIGREGDPYLWGQRDCNPHGGRYSMWGGGGGSLGSLTPCLGGMYTTGYATTLSYGPFDLTECTDVRLNFAHWTWLGAGDFLRFGYSIDGGKVWHLLPISGNAQSFCEGWCEDSFDQKYWPIQLCGQPKVYLVFQFASDAADVNYGTFVDDVSLEAYYPGLRSVFLPLILR